jgi:heme exporter protein CcmD
MSHFLQMGGYARFVWPSYAATLLLVILNIVWARRVPAQAQLEAHRRLGMSSTSRVQS